MHQVSSIETGVGAACTSLLERDGYYCLLELEDSIDEETSLRFYAALLTQELASLYPSASIAVRTDIRVSIPPIVVLQASRADELLSLQEEIRTRVKSAEDDVVDRGHWRVPRGWHRLTVSLGRVDRIIRISRDWETQQQRPQPEGGLLFYEVLDRLDQVGSGYDFDPVEAALAELPTEHKRDVLVLALLGRGDGGWHDLYWHARSHAPEDIPLYLGGKRFLHRYLERGLRLYEAMLNSP